MVSVLPNGLARFCSVNYPGLVSDISIMSRNKEMHEVIMNKLEDEIDIPDVCLLVDDYPDHRTAMCDKGY